MVIVSNANTHHIPSDRMINDSGVVTGYGGCVITTIGAYVTLTTTSLSLIMSHEVVQSSNVSSDVFLRAFGS